MRHLRDDTVLILDGEVRVYRRERSKDGRLHSALMVSPYASALGRKTSMKPKKSPVTPI